MVNLNKIIKDYGIFVLVYILFIILMVKFDYTKQMIMISLLLVSYLYYNTYYSSLPELFNNTKSSFNNIINNSSNDNDFNLNNNDFNLNNNDDNKLNDNQELIQENKKIESNVIAKSSSMYKLNIIKTDIFEFIDKCMPETSREVIQVKQQNNREVAKKQVDILINKYFALCNILLSVNKEELNYYQQIENIQKELTLIVHNTIFLNHKCEHEASNLIQKISSVFKECNNELALKINNRNTHHQKEFIPTINEYSPANKFESGILF
jgi:hypothetical protein